MASAVERLTKLVDAKDRYDIPPAELLPAQLEAANERLAEHRKSIRLVENRAETGDVAKIGEAADLVPLLFAHTAYKSYPESWLSQGKWDRLSSWLDTVSALRVRGIDNEDVGGIDEWIERLAAKGHYICCSSGTTGRISMVPSAMADRDFVKRTCIATYEWATGLIANKDRKIFSCNPGTNNFRFLDSSAALSGAFGSGGEVYRFPGEPITVGRIREMVALRRSIAEGTARPADIAAFEKTSAEREQGMIDAVDGIVESIVANRHEKLLVAGMPALLFRVAAAIEAMGYGAKDFDPDNTLMMAGGLKGAVVPEDYHERTLRAFNIAPRRVFNMYGMQELNTFMPRCEAGRFHVAPWLLLLPLDASGEQLLDTSSGETEGRAAFFDLSHEGRWGGVISGDRIHVAYGKCACGHQGPTIGPEIVRYADLKDGDKISCSGSIDAYVRGAV